MPSSSTELTVHDAAEQLLLTQPQVGCEVTHFFGPGVYVRTVTVEKHVFAVSHRHRLPHLNIVLAGAVAMKHEDEDDSQIRIIRAPYMYVAHPGRKMGLVLEKLVWQNIFATRETDIEKLEEQLFDKSPAFRDAAGKVEAEQRTVRATDRSDFLQALDELGISPEDAEAASRRADDLIDAPAGWDNTLIRNSAIQGRGVFVSTAVLPGNYIAPVRIGDRRTIVGRYTNHSCRPNARFEIEGKDVYLVATAPIAPYCSETCPGDEVTVDYRQLKELAGRLT